MALGAGYHDYGVPVERNGMMFLNTDDHPAPPKSCDDCDGWLAFGNADIKQQHVDSLEFAKEQLAAQKTSPA